MLQDIKITAGLLMVTWLPLVAVLINRVTCESVGVCSLGWGGGGSQFPLRRRVYDLIFK